MFRTAPLLMVLLATTASAGEPLVLAGKGTRSVLITADNWKQGTWCDWGGHFILQRYFELITGVNVPVVAAGTLKPDDLAKFDARIWVGRQPRVDRVFGKDLESLDADGFLIRRDGRDLYISGKHWWGTNWAAHDLLERAAGCRWYGPEVTWWKPEEEGMIGPWDIVPKAAEVRVGEIDVREEPSFKTRWFRIAPLHSFRLRYRDKFSHALVGILPPEKYGKAHPEYYPEIDGRRQVPDAAHAQDFQPCASNPEVVRIVADAAIDFFKRDPDDDCFSIGMNDTDRFCRCAQCRAMAPAAIVGEEARTAYAFFAFYNAVAAEVAKVFPNRRLGCLAYATLSMLPPGSLKLHPMIVPYLTRDSAQLHDANEVREFRELVDRWSRLSHRMGIYEYMYGGGFVVPRIYNRYLIKNIREGYGVAADGFYAEAYPNWGLDGPKYWLAARMLWNNRQDPQALLGEYYRDLFGPAAGEMRRYFDYLEECWCGQTINNGRSNYRWYCDARQLEIFPPEKCDQAWRMLDAAENAAGGDAAIRRRIDFFRSAFAITRVLSRRYHAAARLDVLAAAEPLDLPAALVALEDYATAGDLPAAVKNARRHKDLFNTTGRDSPDDLGQFDRVPLDGVSRLVQEVTRRAVAASNHNSPASIRQAIDRLLAETKTPRPAAAAIKLIGELARDRGFLFVRRAAAPPVVDGKIAAGEWGEPAFRGRFIPAFRIEERAPDPTTFWAVEHGGKLYVAFDLEQDPATVGADVTRRDASTTLNPAELGDDCVVMNFLGAGPFQSVRINANAAVGDDTMNSAAWNCAVAKAGRTATGWQVEAVIDLEKTNLAPGPPSGTAGRMAIARYTRPKRPPDDKRRPETACSTITPIPYGAGIIGRGNHPSLMVFVTGPVVVYQQSRP